MWCEFIKALEPKASFRVAATETQLTELEKTLDVSLPVDLKSLLMESNGVLGEFELRLVWTVEEMHQYNSKMRTDPTFVHYFMPFSCLLFFADAGNGDLFAFSIVQGKVGRSDVYVWNHEDDSRTWAAPSLKVYLEWWLNGKLNI